MSDLPSPAEALRDERPPAPGASTRRWLLLAAKLAVAASLIAYLIASGRLDLAAVAGTRLGWPAALAVGCLLGALFLPCLRWWWLLRNQGIEVPFATAIRLTWIGYFFGLFLPGAASGDLARGYYVIKDAPRARLQAGSTVLADRALGLYSLFFLSLIPWAFLSVVGQATGAVTAMGLTALALAVASSAGLALLLHQRTRGIALGLLPARARPSLDQCLRQYAGHGWGLACCFALSLISNALNVLAFAPAALALGGRLSLAAAFLAAPLVILANSLPISPGGIGVAESTSAALFNSLGVAHGAEVMLVLRLGIMLCALPGAVLYVTTRTRAGG